jgi:hypothetical protein
MKRYLPFCSLLFILLFSANRFFAQKIYLRAFDNTNTLITGDATTSTNPDNQPLIEVQAISSGAFCTGCTPAAPGGSKWTAQTITFNINFGPHLTRLRQLLLSGLFLEKCYFIFTRPDGPGVPTALGPQKDSYIIAVGPSLIQSISESGSGVGGGTSFQVSIAYEYVDYYYRALNTTTGQLSAATSVTWDYVSSSPTLPNSLFLGGY